MNKITIEANEFFKDSSIDFQGTHIAPDFLKNAEDIDRDQLNGLISSAVDRYAECNGEGLSESKIQAARDLVGDDANIITGEDFEDDVNSLSKDYGTSEVVSILIGNVPLADVVGILIGKLDKLSLDDERRIREALRSILSPYIDTHQRSLF